MLGNTCDLGTTAIDNTGNYTFEYFRRDERSYPTLPGRTLTGGLVVFARAGKRLSRADGEEKPASLDQHDLNGQLACHVRTRSNNGTLEQWWATIYRLCQLDRQVCMTTSPILSHLPPEPRVQRRLPCLELMTLLA